MTETAQDRRQNLRSEKLRRSEPGIAFLMNDVVQRHKRMSIGITVIAAPAVHQQRLVERELLARARLDVGVHRKFLESSQ